MKIEVVSIGTELLLGDIVDTNSAYLAKKIAELGYDLYHISTVGDNKTRTVKLLKRSLKRADIVITTGGLGPTTDDLTREAVASCTNNSLYTDQKLVSMIKDYFKEKNLDFTENNLKQAQLPRGAIPLINNKGTAPGLLLEHKQGTIISLPGVPSEMKAIFEKHVFPYLKKQTKETIQSKVFKFLGIGESELETQIKDLISEQNNPTLALLAGKGEVKLRVTAKASSKEKCKNLISGVEKKIRKIVGNYIYALDEQTLPELIANNFFQNKKTLSIAESCTGGLIGDRITNIPGSSGFFLGSIVAYDNKVKQNVLNIPQHIINENGAVSKKTAEKMAAGAKKLFDSEYSLAVTGIAGPGGGTAEKPVGLVFIAVSSPQTSKVYRLNLDGNRKKNKWMTSQYALYYLHQSIQN